MSSKLNNQKNLLQNMSENLKNRLSTEAKEELVNELMHNPEFSQDVEVFKSFIKTKIRKQKVSPTLIQSIKDKIRDIEA